MKVLYCRKAIWLPAAKEGSYSVDDDDGDGTYSKKGMEAQGENEESRRRKQATARSSDSQAAREGGGLSRAVLFPFGACVGRRE